MSITDELREFSPGIHGYKLLRPCDEKELRAIADRIDMEHERLMVERADRYSELRAKMNNCYIELPKDADGEPIHVGDKLIDEDDKLQKPAIVKCILYNDEGCVVSDIDPRGCWYDPSLLRHHAPTVEDVLREFAEKMNENLGMYTGEAIDADEWRSADAKTIAEYAKRLTLADGEDA